MNGRIWIVFQREGNQSGLGILLKFTRWWKVRQVIDFLIKWEVGAEVKLWLISLPAVSPLSNAVLIQWTCTACACSRSLAHTFFLFPCVCVFVHLLCRECLISRVTPLMKARPSLLHRHTSVCSFVCSALSPLRFHHCFIGHGLISSWLILWAWMIRRGKAWSTPCFSCSLSRFFFSYKRWNEGKKACLRKLMNFPVCCFSAQSFVTNWLHSFLWSATSWSSSGHPSLQQRFHRVCVWWIRKLEQAHGTAFKYPLMRWSAVQSSSVTVNG